MKINILYDNQELIEGYTNVDPFGLENPNVVCVSPDQLPCSDGEAEEIILNNVLSYYKLAKVEAILKHCAQKLHHNGCITVTDINPYSVTRKLTLREYSIGELNNLLFGAKHPKKSLVGLEEIETLFKQLGLVIKYKSLDQDEFIITGVRP